jgi:copper oxidase (laccase) domain-containing protein
MIMDASQDTSWLQADGWQRIPGLVHGFSNRVFDREIALNKLKTDDLRLHTLKQVHGDRIVMITQLSSPAERPEADGFLSAEPGNLLGIATADCVPVLMVDPRKGVAAALHAGWRGTLKGIAPRAIELLRSQWNVVAQDLHVREVNTIQIMERGVPRANINLTGPCTFCDFSFASYRREGAGAGRQLSVIGWRKI